MNIEKLLNMFSNYSISTRQKGSSFEELIVKYLKNCNLYKNEIESIWLWDDFPFKTQFSSGKDVGIDIVFKDIFGDYTSVQCKFFENKKIDKADLDSFITTSNRSFTDENNNKINFKAMLFISTTNDWSVEAINATKNQSIDFRIIGLDELSEFDWDVLINNKEKNKKTLRQHQVEAVENVVKGFETADRGKLIMACGTGKTFTSLKIVEALALKQGVKDSLSLSLSRIKTLNAFFWCLQ